MAHRRRVFVRLAHRHAALSALPAPRGAGPYCGRRPEGPSSNHATIAASLTLPSHASLTVLADRARSAAIWTPRAPQPSTGRCGVALIITADLAEATAPPAAVIGAAEVARRPALRRVRHGRLEAAGRGGGVMYGGGGAAAGWGGARGGGRSRAGGGAMGAGVKACMMGGAGSVGVPANSPGEV